MADNYIERQQEQYEARKAAWKQAQKYGKKKTGTTHQVRTGQADKIPSDANRRKRRVFVTGGRNRQSNRRSIFSSGLPGRFL